MKQKKSKSLEYEDVIKHKNSALSTLNTFLGNCINNVETIKKADLLSYWLEDYIKYLSYEKIFNPKLYKSYKRGDIIKVNLGFNVGAEEGRSTLRNGRRYA